MKNITCVSTLRDQVITKNRLCLAPSFLSFFHISQPTRIPPDFQITRAFPFSTHLICLFNIKILWVISSAPGQYWQNQLPALLQNKKQEIDIKSNKRHKELTGEAEWIYGRTGPVHSLHSQSQSTSKLTDLHTHPRHQLIMTCKMLQVCLLSYRFYNRGTQTNPL